MSENTQTAEYVPTKNVKSLLNKGEKMGMSYCNDGVMNTVNSDLSSHAVGSVVKFRIPRLDYLGCDSYFIIPVTSGGANSVLDSIYSVFDNILIRINGTEVLNTDWGIYMNHWVLSSPGSKLDRLYKDLQAQGFNASLTADTEASFVMRLPYNFILNGIMLPLKHLDSIEVELRVSQSGRALKGAGATLSVGACKFKMNTVQVEPELDRAFQNQLFSANTNPKNGMRLNFVNFYVQGQAMTANAGEEIIMFNDTVSSMRNLEVLIQDTAKNSALGQDASGTTSIVNGLTEFWYMINGKQYPRSRVTVGAGESYEAYLNVSEKRWGKEAKNSPLIAVNSHLGEGYKPFGTLDGTIAPGGLEQTTIGTVTTTANAHAHFVASLDISEKQDINDIITGLRVNNSLSFHSNKTAGVAGTAYLVEEYDSILFLSSNGAVKVQ